MHANFLFGLPVMAFCLLLQTVLLVVAFRFYYREERLLDNDSFWSSMAVITGVMMLLVVGNLGQIAVWAWLFELLGEFDQYHIAFYHSAVNFSSLGYGDIVMSEKHRLLGGFEALNGVLMVGVSTAAMMTTFQDAIRRALAKYRT